MGATIGFAREEVIQNQTLMDILEGTQEILFGYAQKLGQYVDAANQLYQENQAYNTILTNPDVLSDYTLKFFGPEGLYPVYQSEAELEYGDQMNQVGGINPAQYIQQMPGTPEPYIPEGGSVNDVWKTFDAVMQSQPENAWRVLNQLPPQVLQSKLLVME